MLREIQWIFPSSAFTRSCVINQIWDLWLQQNSYLLPHIHSSCLYVSIFSQCSIEDQSSKGPWTNPYPPSSSWSTDLNHVIMYLLMTSSPKRKWCFLGERVLHKKLAKSLRTWGVTRTERLNSWQGFILGIFLLKWQQDRSTWETSCICLPFIETRVTRAERVPISDTPHLWFRVKTKRHLVDHLSSKYLLSRSS